MSYRFNFTGRKRIPQECITITLAEGRGGPPSFDAQINLPAELQLPDHARVYVEPYVKTSAMRFAFGTVGNPEMPTSRVLTEIDVGASVLFRVKVVDETNEIGKILASANGIRPRSLEDGDDRKPLLPLRIRDLGEELWKLEFSKEAGPEIVVSNRVPGLGDMVRTSALLQGTIFPEVVRQMVGNIFGGDVEDDLEWVVDWKRFLAAQLGEEIDEDDLPESGEERTDALKELADRAAEGFASRQGFARRLSTTEVRDV
jgi:hypothetical protein